MAIRGKYLVVVLAMCGLSAATVGLITNVAGLFFGPIAEEFGVSRGEASLMLTISNICVALGGLATRRLTKLLPLRVMVLVGAAVLAGSAAATAMVPNMWLAYVLAATRGLAGGAIGFVLITYVLNKWFVAQLGLATSIAMGCSGIAGALLTPVIQPVVVGAGWRAGHLLVAGLSAAFCLPALLLVPSCDPHDAGLAPLGGSDVAAADAAQPSAEEEKPAIQVDHLLAAGAVVYAALAAAVSAMPQHFPGLAAEAGLDAAAGAAMISASMIANTLGKVVMGWLTDRFGARMSILAYSVLIVAAIAGMLFVHTPLVFIGAAFLFGLCYSRATVGLSMLCREVFGKRGFGVVYPVAALGCTISNAVFSSAVGFAYDATGGYTASLVLFAAFVVVSSGIVVWEYQRAAAQEG